MFSAAREQAIWRIYVGTQAVVILLRDRGSCLTVPSLARSSLDLCPAPAFSPPGNHSCWDFTILSSSSGKPLCWRASCAGAWHSAPRWHTSFSCLEARDRLCWKRLFRLRLRGTEKFIDLTFQCPAVWRSWSSCDHTSIVAPGTIRQVEGATSRRSFSGRVRSRRAEKGGEGQMLNASQASEASLLSLAGQASAITGAITFSEKKPLSSLTIRRLQHTVAWLTFHLNQILSQSDLVSIGSWLNRILAQFDLGSIRSWLNRILAQSDLGSIRSWLNRILAQFDLGSIGSFFCPPLATLCYISTSQGQRNVA